MKFILPFLTLSATAASSSHDFQFEHSARMTAILKARHFNTKRDMATKRSQLQSTSSLRTFKPSFMQEDQVECDWYNEETCYDEEYNAVSCEPYVDGGCPCPSGQEKCGFSAEEKMIGYCTLPEFCCSDGEELCYDENWNATGCMAIADGGCGCPEGQVKCGADSTWNYSGYCTEVCCGEEEETCYDETGIANSCAAISDGGCDCPEGQVKCGADPTWNYSGYCTEVCCGEEEETCYDETYTAIGCADIASGGCDCPGEQVKCGAEPEWNYTGYCTDVCCGDDEETCYDYDTNSTTCADIASGGCDCPEGQVKCGADPTSNFTGYCTEVCCGDDEETCYDYGTDTTTCAALSAGGCECPEGQTKCGANPDENYAGYCTEVCCSDDEELCYSDESWYPSPSHCASVAEGGCPCPEGESKCGADPSWNYAGYCTSLCCEEQTCYDWTTYEPASCATWDEECPSGISFDNLRVKAMTMMRNNGMKDDISKLHKIKANKAVMLGGGHTHHKAIEKMEVAIFREAKHIVDRKPIHQDVPVFMTAVY